MLLKFVLVSAYLYIVLAQECKPGYFLTDSNKCVACAVNCLDCESEKRCKTCNEGNFLDTSNGECFKCPSLCESCTSPNKCIKCSFGYSKDSICHPCDYSCLKCSETECLECPENTYKDGKVCKNCQSGCLKCESGEKCLECYSEYNLIDDNCVYNEKYNPCELGEPGSCTKCYEYYFLDSGTCRLCSDNCQKCTNKENCENCYQGFYNKEGICVLCSDFCSVCESEKECSSCYDGYYKKEGICEPCGKFCSVCESDKECSSCYDGYFLNEDKECEMCEDNCSLCKSKDCSSCVEGYYLVDGECIQCEKPCTLCENDKICKSCEYYYYYLEDNICKECGENCIFCNNDKDCTYCKSGYYVLEGKCHQCLIENCQECYIDGCLYCNEGYILNEGKCELLDSCVSEDSGECLLCSSDKYLADSKCVQNSLYCYLSQYYSDRCNECAYGFYLNNKKKCSSCYPLCSLCIERNYCIECYPETYKNDEGVCIACPSNCWSCDENGCKECNYLYELVDGKCECTISTGCDIYYYKESMDKLASGTSCGAGTFWTGNECSNCMQGCKSCSSSTNCEDCYSEFCYVDGYCYEQEDEVCQSLEMAEGLILSLAVLIIG